MHMLRRSDRLLDRAASALRNTVAAEPDNAAAWRRLGDVYRGLGKLPEALECYRRVVALCPDEPKAVRLCAILSGQELPDAPPGSRPLPFVRLTSFLPAQRCRDLLALALASRTRFKPSQVFKRKRAAIRGVRRGLIADRWITDRMVRPWFEAQLRRAFAQTLPRLEMRDPSEYWVDMRMSAYPGTGFFLRHTDEEAFHERKVSFVYYFHRQPRRFSGGDLLLHDGDGTQAFTRIEPQHNSIVLFPPACLHEVVTVESDSVDWRDVRFAMHGWLRTDLEAEPSAGEREGAPLA